MPEAPSVSPLTRHFFENPWALIVLSVIACVMLLVAAHRTRRGLLGGAALAALIPGLVAWILAAAVETSGERSRGVVTAMMDAAVANQVGTALSYLDPEAALALGNPANPGHDRSFIERGMDRLQTRYGIQQNSINRLDSYTLDGNTAEVHVRCHTEVHIEKGIGIWVHTGWVFRVERGAEDRWLVKRITFVDYDGQTPTMDVF